MIVCECLCTHAPSFPFPQHYTKLLLSCSSCKRKKKFFFTSSKIISKRFICGKDFSLFKKIFILLILQSAITTTDWLIFLFLYFFILFFWLRCQWNLNNFFSLPLFMALVCPSFRDFNLLRKMRRKCIKKIQYNVLNVNRNVEHARERAHKCMRGWINVNFNLWNNHKNERK